MIFHVLVIAGVLSGTPPQAQAIDVFPTKEACVAAKKELDAQPNSDRVEAIGIDCAEVEVKIVKKGQGV